ncbi:stage II sporulation protein M [Paenactinomyces guangxiensis]|uniref:Stage II sporulation protein M n=1 Tax=Paenactinomyces guangxiensis TaxID=1490290 RepID=A0A7W1WUY0_9BACL|nr:stage II sporulation protein M [Paenactinomyces guangxiensis]MBA4496575.1 stage II sporulation protein M [Paenactinomyces guangxiensis]MBH8593699.1 stage II sporulation protein M [Paenactinomyces guangxiensis]
MQRFMHALKAEQRYLGIAILVFVVSAVSGYVNGEGIFKTLKEMGVLDSLEEVVRSISQNPSFFHIFTTLFVNNITASFSMIGMGLFFGIVPFMSMLTNGMLLGATLMTAAEKTGTNPLVIFVTTILPHGVLELPAAILAAAFGMRLGVAAIRRIIALFVPRLHESSVEEWRGIRTRLPVVLVGVTVLILVAAVIETSLILYLKPQS